MKEFLGHEFLESIDFGCFSSWSTMVCGMRHEPETFQDFPSPPCFFNTKEKNTQSGLEHEFL